MKIFVIPTGSFNANCYLIYDCDNNAVIVDPGTDCEVILDKIKSAGITPRAYLLTHGHFDHISDINAMVAALPAPVLLGHADAYWAFSPANSYPPYAALTAPPPGLDTDLYDGRVLKFGKLKLEVMLTPGHTPGGVCYYLPEHKTLISGDTIFRESVGRTDLPGGNWEVLTESFAKLMALDDAVHVLPGHGGTTTIGHERTHNPYINNTFL